MALLKKGVYSSVILPDEDKHTKNLHLQNLTLGKTTWKESVHNYKW